LYFTAELPGRPLWVLGDSTRLKQVIGNGLQNASKFTDSGGTVAVSLRNEDGETAVLTIRDTGIGMDEEMLKRAFEPFSQAEIGSRRNPGGLGLGLAVVKGLIDLHNGNVTLRSGGPGTGSELIMRLPLSQSSSGESEAIVPAARRTSLSQRILLIEDNLMGSRTMRMLLTQIGHQCQVAHTGQEGIEAARRFQPQVVLCDIGLPDISGFAVARALRQDPATAKACLIALSGYGEAEYQRQASRAGFNMYLIKPVDIDDLSKLLDRVTPAGDDNSRAI
jgi:two-component system CheB/CheR fusion protein